MIIVGVLSISIGGVLSRPRTIRPVTPIAPPTEEAMDANILAPQHVARFGDELFGRHLIAVEVAGRCCWSHWSAPP